jgi:hypothetical protein
MAAANTPSKMAAVIALGQGGVGRVFSDLYCGPCRRPTETPPCRNLESSPSLPLMPRFRALLAVLLAITWCSAVMHGGLEAVGMMFEHKHHAHDHDAATNPTEHAPLDHDDHEPVVTRDVAKDNQIRVNSSGVLGFTVLGTLLVYSLSVRPSLVEVEAPPKRRRTDPPLAQVWQFVQRCAPESAAPPALG